MNRREFLSLAATPALLQGQTQKPNVLMIAVDDWNDWIGALGGHPQVRTPNVDRLAANEMAARWTAIAVAAITTNIAINAVAVKGELLALPFLMGSLWLALLAVRDKA